MPPIAARDTPARRKLQVIDAVTRHLDQLPDEAINRVLTWIDGLVDGDTAEAELKAMKAIAAKFAGVDATDRESIVRWLNENYLDQAKPSYTSASGADAVVTEYEPESSY